MMTNEERIRALQDTGYSQREAAFLCLAALHSGFFLRRQYRDYLGAGPGYADDLLITKMLNLAHGRVITSGRHTQVCHLCSRPFYAAIGEPDNRHRRRRSPLSMKAKLMALDYVIAHPGAAYLATEEEKVDLFCRRLGVARDCLPTKTYRSKTESSTTDRYFVDKFPIALQEESPTSPPVISFCYIDEGSVATPGFDTWLGQYAGLFAALGRFRVVYVATKETQFVRAERLFRPFSRSTTGWNRGATGSLNERLLRYFQLENAYRLRAFDRLDADKLDDLRRLRKEFADERTERLFEVWRQGGEQPVIGFLDEERAGVAPGEALFVTCRLPWNYDFLFAHRMRRNAQLGG